MKPTKELRHFKNLGIPTPPADPFHWGENQRVRDVATLRTALLQAADKFRNADTETPTESFSALKGSVLDEGDLLFTADYTFHSPYQAVLVLEEIASALGGNQTAGNEGADNTWSLRVGRTVTVIDGNIIWLRANFLAPTRDTLAKWLMEYAAWAFETDHDPKREPQPQTTQKRTAQTYSFHCSLKETARDLRNTLLTITNKLCFREADSDEFGSGEYAYTKAAPAPVRVKTPDPEFFVWIEDHRFETESAVIAALENAARAVINANINYTGGGGSFGGFGKLPSSGTYRFRSSYQFGSKEFCGQTLRSIAREIGNGIRQGVIGNSRWSLTMGEPEEFSAPAEPAPEPEKQPEAVLPAATSSENPSPEPAQNQPGAS